MKGRGFVQPTREAPPAAHAVIGASQRPSSIILAAPIVWDQLNTERCAGYAAEQAAHCFLAARAVPHNPFSPTFPWWCSNRERVPRDEDVRNEGVDPYTFVDACLRFGSPELLYWDPSIEEFTKRPVDVAFQRAQSRKLRVSPIYETGGARLDRMYDALAQKIPLLLAKPVDAEYEEDSGPFVIGPIVGKPLGAHMTCGYAYDEEGNVLEAGSWSGAWRNGGKAALTPDCIIQSVSWCATLEVL